MSNATEAIFHFHIGQDSQSTLSYIGAPTPLRSVCPRRCLEVLAKGLPTYAKSFFSLPYN